MNTTETALPAQVVKPYAKVDDRPLVEIERGSEVRFQIGHTTIQFESGDSAQPCEQEPDETVLGSSDNFSASIDSDLSPASEHGQRWRSAGEGGRDTTLTAHSEPYNREAIHAKQPCDLSGCDQSHSTVNRPALTTEQPDGAIFI